MLWINAELRFPNKDWDEFLADEEGEVKSIERKVSNLKFHGGAAAAFIHISGMNNCQSCRPKDSCNVSCFCLTCLSLQKA